MLDILTLGVIAYGLNLMMQPGMVLHWYYKLIDKIPYDYLFKPLGGCLACFSGQIGAWYYLFTHLHGYNFIQHLFFICGTIVIAMILDKIIDYESSDN